MALNDLASSVAQTPFTVHPLDETVEPAVVSTVLELLGDTNTEVKNLAVKTYVRLYDQVTQTGHADDQGTERVVLQDCIGSVLVGAI